MFVMYVFKSQSARPNMIGKKAVSNYEAAPMTTRRDVIKTVAVASIAMNIAGVKDIMAADTHLNWKHFPAGEHGFFRAPVLISGAREAVLIDGGFTLSDGRALAAAIKSSG